MVFSNKSEMCSRDPIYSLYPCHYHVVVGCDIACSPALKDPEGFYGPKKGMSVSLPDEDGTFVMVPDNGCLSLILHFSEGYRIERHQAENQAYRVFVYKTAEQGGVVIVPSVEAEEWYRLIPESASGQPSSSMAEYYHVTKGDEGSWDVECISASFLLEVCTHRSRPGYPPFTFDHECCTDQNEWFAI